MSLPLSSSRVAQLSLSPSAFTSLILLNCSECKRAATALMAPSVDQSRGVTVEEIVSGTRCSPFTLKEFEEFLIHQVIPSAMATAHRKLTVSECA